MTMTRDAFTELLIGKDLRSVRQNSIVVRAVKDQPSFDELFVLVFHHQRQVAMRAIDAIEKITKYHPEFLTAHKSQLMILLKSADHKELKWHIAQLIARMELSRVELMEILHILDYWIINQNEGKLVRVHALQTLFDLSTKYREVEDHLVRAISKVEHELSPSIQARVRKLKKLL